MNFSQFGRLLCRRMETARECSTLCFLLTDSVTSPAGLKVPMIEAAVRSAPSKSRSFGAISSMGAWQSALAPRFSSASVAGEPEKTPSAQTGTRELPSVEHRRQTNLVPADLQAHGSVGILLPMGELLHACLLLLRMRRCVWQHRRR